MIDRIARMDKGIFLVSLLMMGFGIVLVYSSSFAIAQQKFGGADFFLARHIVRVLMAMVCLFFFISMDYHALGRLSSIAYLVAVLMLIYTLTLPGNHAINGAKRWMSIGFIQFQVSEIARIALILSLAMHSQKVGDRIREGRMFIQQLLKIGIICVLVMIEPNFSTAMILGCLGLVLLFVAGAKLLHVAAVFCALIPIGIIAVITEPYRFRRLLGYTNGSGAKSGAGYQIYQSLIGLGHGGLFGVGLGQGEQKYFYLPEPHTDFVFSILGEEIGFIGLIIVCAIFCFLIYRGMKVALRAPDIMGQVMAFGLTLVVGMYGLLHAFVNTGIVPTTGVPLPFLSYGGMSLIFTMSSMGILLNISSQRSEMIYSPGKRKVL